MSPVRLALLFFAGCELPLPLPNDTDTEPTDGEPTDTDGGGVPAPDPFEVLTYEGQSGDDGTFEVVVGVEEDVTSFQITAVCRCRSLGLRCSDCSRIAVINVAITLSSMSAGVKPAVLAYWARREVPMR